jgi:hypothetical protein
MSDTKIHDEWFDAWLTAKLKTPSQMNPAFTEKLVLKMERLNAQKMLRKVLWHERIAAGAALILLASIIGLLCCPPILRRIYALLETIFMGIFRSLLQPQPVDFAVGIAGAILLILLLRSVWKSLISGS